MLRRGIEIFMTWDLSRNIQNVIAKLESGRGGSRHALLVNCHFDSVPQSPGKATAKGGGGGGGLPSFGQE